MFNKVYISYFYKVRFLPKNYIPISTALWDPKWFHNFKDQNHVFRDKRGVINGLRYSPFIPGEGIQCLCRGRDNQIACNGNPEECNYLKRYYNQISKVKATRLLEYLDINLNKLLNRCNIKGDAVPVFMVHETPDNLCSERKALFKYFNENNIEVEEFDNEKENIC